MFEGLVRQLILGYLGQYIKDIQKEQLKITLWNEEVLLENVELILEAFDYLRLPFAFKQGTVGKLSIKIPWKKLGWDPIIIILEDVYICVCQRDDKEWCMDAVERREFASKKAQLAAAELAKLSRRVCDNHTGKSFISYITAKILDSIQLSIRNVHVLYQDSVTATADIVFGLKFSSLTIMKQSPIGSSIAKVRGGQVNKSIEIQNLELYYNTFEADDSSTKSDVDSENNRKERLQDVKYSSLLAPLNVLVSLSVNRSGKLFNDAPQYTINVELAHVAMSVDEVQLQQILSLCDYMSLCQLRDKYGRYRPWRSPLGEKLDGWQIAWWHYAQKSVLSDVQRRLKKTSWKYFGERLNSRRKYVNLYKIKLKCLRHDQVIEEDVQHELEEVEKETDIDDILNNRSIAERELEDFLVNPSSSHGSNGGGIVKLVEDDRPTGKTRGWLNWLSYGMLGAGGTNDSSQFSGVISDEVIKDIYEATKFHPAPALTGDSAVMDEVYFSSMKVNISEICTTLRSMKLGQAIADLTLKQISIEGKVWEKSTIITTSINSAQLLNPLNNQVVMFSRKASTEDNIIEEQQPSVNIKVDLSAPSSDVNSSVKVILNPIEVFVDLEFVKNILEVYHVLHCLSFQQQRILLSLDGFDDFNTRLQLKINYALSSSKKTVWDINLFNSVINIPWKNANFEMHTVVVEATCISFASKADSNSFGSHKGDQSHFRNNYVDFSSGSIGNILTGFQLQDLYDYFEIQINEMQMKLLVDSSTSAPLFEKFNVYASLVSCVLPGEQVLKGSEVRVQVPSLSFYFSSSMYGVILGLIAQYNLLLRSSDSASPLDRKSDKLKYSWFSINVNMEDINLIVNLEDDVADGCILKLYCQMLDLGYDRRDLPEGWVSVQACKMTASSVKDEWRDQVLCLIGNISGAESLNQHNMGVKLDSQNRHLSGGSSNVDKCIVLHYEAHRNKEWFLHKYTLCASDLDIHCFPYIVGKFVGFLDKMVVCGATDMDMKPDVGDGNVSSKHGSEFHQNDLSNIHEFASNEFPLDTSMNLRPRRDLESIVNDITHKLGKALNLSDQENEHPNFGLLERSNIRSAPLVNDNVDAGSLVRGFNNSDSHYIDLNLDSVKVHFHDSSCIIATIMLPLVKSLISVSVDFLDVICSTEGLVLSSPWWSQIWNEFFWGPLSLNLSPVLNLHLKKRNTGSQKSPLEMNFDIRHVSCILLHDFLAIIIGYFSLPDWSSCGKEQSSDNTSVEDPEIIVYKFEIVDCDLITPANYVCSEFLKVNIKNLCITFSEDCDKSCITKGIPSACCIGAGKFADRYHCLDFCGRDLSLSLLLSENDMVNPLSRCKKILLIEPLSADVWVRIPNDSEFSNASPTCIMAMVNDCQLEVDEVWAISGFKALGYVIDQFSLVEEESSLFTSDVPHFLQGKKQMMEEATVLPETSNVTFNVMKFCVKSLSLRLHRCKRDSTYFELVAEADMHFVCSLLLKNGNLQSLDISFSSLALFSSLNSVLLAECECLGSVSSVLDMTLSVSDCGESQYVLSLSCLDVWLYLSDWSEVADLLNSYSEQLSKVLTSGTSGEAKVCIPSDTRIKFAGDGPNNVASTNTSHVAGKTILTLTHVGLAVHFPALVSRDRHHTFGRLHLHDMQQLDDYPRMLNDNQNCFFSINMESRNSELVVDGKTVKLILSSENLSGVLKLFTGGSGQTWPLFQISKINLDAEILEHRTDNVDIRVEVWCERLDLSLSNHILHLLQYTWFEKSEEVPSRYNFNRMDFKVQLKKCSLLLTDWKRTSSGPLLEFLVRNSILWCTVMEDEIEGSTGHDLQVNYYNIDKVLWEPFVEPWKFQLSMSRKHDERALFNGSIMTDIKLESTTHLNMNINESIIEVISRAIEMIKDACGLIEMKKSSGLSNSQIIKNPETMRYAPYMLQNLATVPLVFHVCQRQLVSDNLDVSPSQGILQPGSSTHVYINESPEELLFRYRRVESSDRLNDKQLLEAAHRYVTFQLEGTSAPSTPISMDLVGRRYFEVDFSKPSHASEVHSNADTLKRNKKLERDTGTDTVRGFVVPVVIDVSVQRYTKLMRLYSTVVILNTTSVPLEIRFDIPFGVSPKILGPIYPGQEFPLPLHLAEAGCIRWRPLGDSYLWSEVYNISNIISQHARIGVVRSFVCYPSHPSSEAFRCCISVNDQVLPPIDRLKRVSSAIDVSGKQPLNRHGQSSKNVETPNRFLYQVILTSPLVLKNYLMKSISLTLEDAGVTRAANLSEVENSFFHIDPSHDLSVTFQMRGFRPSSLKFPRAESFGATAKFSGTKFSTSEIIRFEPEFSAGPLYVTMEKVMNAFSGAREILISVPFLLYNCTGFSLVLSNSVNEMKGYSCIIPSCYNLDEKSVLVEKKDGLGFICSNHDLPDTDFTSATNTNSPDFAESDCRKVTACLFSPDPSSNSGEIMVKLSRYIPSVVQNFPKRSWSPSFSLVPQTGSNSILVPQPSMASGYVISVSAVAAPFSGRTKIILFEPRYVIANACTKNLCYKQKGTEFPFVLRAGQHSHIQWMDTTRELLLSVRFDEPGWEWSGCFLPEQLGDTQVKVRNYMTAAVSMVRVEVRSADVSVREEKIVGSTSGNSGTNLILLFDDDTGFMPYRIDNHSRERLRIYQPKCESFETVIHPYTSYSYAWDEPCYPHSLTIEVPGERVLGSYAIDDASDQSLVYLPATSEKPERNFLISVHSEGAIKVLSIIDSSYHVLDDLKSLHVPHLKNKRKQIQKFEDKVDYKERLSVDIPFLGISLMNSHPEELLFACCKNTKVKFVQSLDQQQFSLQIASFQIDNQLRTTPYPVLLSFNHGNKGNVLNQMKFKDNSRKVMNGDMPQVPPSNLHEPVFSLAISKWRNNDTSLVSFESISLRIADFYLDIEQDIILRLFEFCKTASSRLQSRIFQHMHSTQHPLFHDLDFAEISGNEKQSNFTNATLLQEDYRKGCLLLHMVPIGAPWQQVQIPARKQKKIYVELFDLAPIKLTLSFSSSPWMLRHGVLTSGESLIHRGLMALADVEGAKIHFKHLILSHQIASLESIQEILVSHYSRQFLHEMYKVFGSAGVIGNPLGFARSLSLGIKDFFSLPIWNVIQSPAGLITGMAQGTTSLLSNTVYAISDATSQFSKAAHKGIVAFTFDDQIVTMMDKQQKGMSSHSKGVINEFLEGLTGVLQSPIKGAEKHGLPGVLSGIAVGVTGLVARPAASILEVTGKTAQSIRNRSRIHQMGYRCFRVRLPRPLSRELPLKPYSWEEAIGTYVLTETDMKLRDETLVMCKALKQQCGEYVLVTGRLILVVSCSSLIDLGKPNFEGVPADLKWVIKSEIGMESVILADSDGDVVHIVGSGSFRQNQQPQQQRGIGGAKGKLWNNFHTPLPLFQTNLEFTSSEEADEFLRVVMCMIERGKEQGWGSVYILHQSNAK
ncbi:hypothetical protein ACJIZ3_019466 [Penstemon smallii]|uniref:Vacuolar protein sorting-associated protein n=1 Tax=Penstemon smallii TaxID=265156 RepID=A0ABD3T186_9LAMI